MSTFTNLENKKKYLTILKISGINKGMRKTLDEKTSQKTKDILSYFALSFAIIFAIGFILFFIYGIASAIAFKPLVPLVIFGASIVFLGLGSALFSYFFNHKIKKDKKEEVKTKTEKVTTWAVVKEYITFSNAAFALVIIGAVLLFSSIGLGSLKKPNWKVATSSFMKENGYHDSALHYDIKYDVAADVNKIDIDLKDKNVVVIYDKENKFITLEGYELYNNEVTLTNVQSGTLYLRETESPRQHKLDNMFWFIFKNNKYEAQIRIYIPISEKDNVTIVGNYIEAKE